MCICCAAVPVAVATGLSLDKKQRKNAQAQGRTPKHVRTFVLLTVIAIFLLNAGSVILHTRFYRLGL
jgi:flagellar biosynthesis protein FliP